MASDNGYEFFEHTADIGIRGHGRTLQDLFINMARGLTELLVENSVIAPEGSRTIELQAATTDDLLLAWLQEILFRFSSERFVPDEYEIEDIGPTRVQAILRGGVFDPSRHVQGREVKAITRHELAVRQTASGWEAEVIVDV